MILLSLLLQMQAVAAEPTKESPAEAAAAAFREGCIHGALRLPPSRGRILKSSEIPDFADIFQWGRSTTVRRVIRFNYPSSTYLAFADYKNVQPKSVVRVCALISGALSHREAGALFLEGLPDKELRPEWRPNMYIPRWTANHPELGYVKSLRFRDDGSVVLQVGMYTSAIEKQADMESKH